MHAPESNPSTEYLVNDDPARSFAVRVSTTATQHFVLASGELDYATRYCLYQACIGGEDVAVVVDLSAITFMDCGGYGAIEAARRFLEARGNSLTICNQTGQPARLLDDYFSA